jgi:hypothetical protein
METIGGGMSHFHIHVLRQTCSMDISVARTFQFIPCLQSMLQFKVTIIRYNPYLMSGSQFFCKMLNQI